MVTNANISKFAFKIPPAIPQFFEKCSFETKGNCRISCFYNWHSMLAKIRSHDFVNRMSAELCDQTSVLAKSIKRGNKGSKLCSVFSSANQNFWKCASRKMNTFELKLGVHWVMLQNSDGDGNLFTSVVATHFCVLCASTCSCGQSQCVSVVNMDCCNTRVRTRIWRHFK